MSAGKVTWRRVLEGPRQDLFANGGEIRQSVSIALLAQRDYWVMKQRFLPGRYSRYPRYPALVALSSHNPEPLSTAAGCGTRRVSRAARTGRTAQIRSRDVGTRRAGRKGLVPGTQAIIRHTRRSRRARQTGGAARRAPWRVPYLTHAPRESGDAPARVPGGARAPSAAGASPVRRWFAGAGRVRGRARGGGPVPLRTCPHKSA